MCVWDFLTFCLAGLIFFNTSQVSTECQWEMSALKFFPQSWLNSRTTSVLFKIHHLYKTSNRAHLVYIHKRVNMHLLPPIHCSFVCGFMIVNEQHVEQEILSSSWDFASGQYFSGWSLHRLLLNVWMDYSEIVFMVPRGWILLTSVCSATRKLTFFSFKGNILTSIGWTEIW